MMALERFLVSILCKRYEFHVWERYQVFREHGFCPDWKRCTRCGKMLDEHLDDVEAVYDKVGENYFMKKTEEAK